MTVIPEEKVEESSIDELPEEEKEARILNLKVLAVIREAQQKHGLRHADYQRYRGYCSRYVIDKVIRLSFAAFLNLVG